MKLPWSKKDLGEEVRRERGRLAEAIVRNDRVRGRLAQRARENQIGDLLEEIFMSLDEVKRRD